jgi:hypothetical protein
MNPSKQPITLQDSSDSKESGMESSPEYKISKKDHYFINTMLKIHDTMDKQHKDKNKKEPEFSRLEPYHKQLILNTSAVTPFDAAPTKPIEFYQNFLSKKSQFKVKDMLIHCLQMEKIAFHPNATYFTNLWNCEFYWILPDSPSGISIFFCPETKSLNAHELEKEHNLALADKIKNADIEKLSKQKIYLPQPKSPRHHFIVLWQEITLCIIPQ